MRPHPQSHALHEDSVTPRAAATPDVLAGFCWGSSGETKPVCLTEPVRGPTAIQLGQIPIATFALLCRVAGPWTDSVGQIDVVPTAGGGGQECCSLQKKGLVCGVVAAYLNCIDFYPTSPTSQIPLGPIQQS